MIRVTDVYVVLKCNNSPTEMPLKAELDAIRKMYVKLMKLPVKDMLLAFTEVLPITVVVKYTIYVIMSAWLSQNLGQN